MPTNPDEIKGLSDAAKSQKEILDAIPDDQAPQPPSGAFETAVQQESAQQSEPQVFTDEQGNRLEMRDVPAPNDAPEILKRILDYMENRLADDIFRRFTESD